MSYEFINQKHIEEASKTPIPFGSIGDIVDTRTYRRFLPEQNRRETAYERNARVVNYNINLALKCPNSPSIGELQEEALLMFDSMNKLIADASGRTKWCGGSVTAEKNPASQFNCSFSAINRLEAFTQGMSLLLVGCGFGYRVFESDVDQLPEITNKNIEVHHEFYRGLSKNLREENTHSYKDTRDESTTVNIVVGDSREAWEEAMLLFLQAYTSEDRVDFIQFNYDSVRPYGEKIKSFGGNASGHQALQKMFEDIERIIKEVPGNRLRPIDCSDIICAIASGVVVGGARRCLPSNALVSTNTGLKKIEDIRVNDLVLTGKDRYKPVLATYNTGLRQECIIKTNLGEFTSSPDHRWAVLKNIEGDIEWKEAKDLKSEDRIVTVPQILEGKKTTLPFFEYTKPKKDQTSTDISIPELDNDLAWFFGFFHGNGTCRVADGTTSETGGYVSVACSNTLPETHTRSKAQLEKFGVSCSDYFGAKEACSKPKVSSIQLATYFGQFKTSNITMDVPDFILEGTVEFRSNYIAGLFDADGYITKVNQKKGSSLTIASSVYPKYLEQIRSVLFSLGIVSKIVLSRKEDYKPNWKALYHINLVSESDTEKFKNLVSNYSIRWQTYKEYQKTRSVSKRALTFNGNIVRNSTYSNKFDYAYRSANGSNLSLYKAESVLGELDYKPVTVKEIIITDSFLNMYDIQVADDARFVANGMLVHNSALICLFGSEDEDMATSKTDIYTNPDKAHKKYRSQANITQALTEKPSLEWLKNRMQTVRYLGEPGICNYTKMQSIRKEAALTYRPDANPLDYTDVGSNPCFEILLSAGTKFGAKYAQLGKSGSFCNLTTQPLTNHVKNGKLDWIQLEESTRLITRIGLRQTQVDIPMDGWNETQLEERLLGVSATGWIDLFDMLGIKYDSEEAIDIRESVRFFANDEATKYSKKLGVPRPLMVTCCKPDGTSSQVYGTSWGVHWNWSPYYLRRVRISRSDALAQTLLQQGYKAYPELDDLHLVADYVSAATVESHALDQDKLVLFDSLTIEQQFDLFAKCKTLVFEFPIKSPAKTTQADVSALEQLENQLLFTRHYVDHMSSCTITVKDGEWDSLAEAIYDNWDDYVTASFLPYYGGDYPLLPFQQISEEEYYTHLAKIPEKYVTKLENGKLYFQVDQDILQALEAVVEDPDEVSIDADCGLSTGCPIR